MMCFDQSSLGAKSYRSFNKCCGQIIQKPHALVGPGHSRQEHQCLNQPRTIPDRNEGEVLRRLLRRFGADDHDLRIAHVAIDRKHTTAEDRPPTSRCRIAPPRRRGPHRVGGPAFSWRADESQPSCDAGTGLSGDRRALQGGRRRCRDPGSQLPRLPPDVQPRRAHAGGNGIATIVMGCAKDIVEHVGVPRFLFSDFPLGNAAGRPKDPVSQAFTLDLALRVLETAPAPRTTVQSPLAWRGADWKLDYCNIERLTPEEIARRRANSTGTRRRLERCCAKAESRCADSAGDAG